MKILFATMPFDGHFNPLTGVAMHLKAAGLVIFSAEQREF